MTTADFILSIMQQCASDPRIMRRSRYKRQAEAAQYALEMLLAIAAAGILIIDPKYSQE